MKITSLIPKIMKRVRHHDGAVGNILTHNDTIDPPVSSANTESNIFEHRFIVSYTEGDVTQTTRKSSSGRGTEKMSD